MEGGYLSLARVLSTLDKTSSLKIGANDDYRVALPHSLLGSMKQVLLTLKAGGEYPI